MRFPLLWYTSVPFSCVSRPKDGSLVLAGFAVFGTFLWNTLPPKTQSVSPEENSFRIGYNCTSVEILFGNGNDNDGLPPFRVLLRHPDTIASAYVNDNPVIVTRATVEIPSKQVSLSFPDEAGYRVRSPLCRISVCFSSSPIPARS